MTEELKTISDELFKQFEWYFQNFNNPIQQASNDFLYEGLNFKLISVSKNINTMFQEDSYFVTKVKIDPQNEIYIRCSADAVNAILTKALGKTKSFEINKITELEAKIITAFNDNLYNFISNAFSQAGQQSRKFDITHMAFILNDFETKLCGKFIISFPSQLVLPEEVVCHEQKFSNSFFEHSFVDVNIKIGTTEFTVGDLKNLEPEDIIVLENSNIQTMQLSYKGYETDFRIAPNPALIMSIDNNEGEDMGVNMPPENLWDSIQVEMGAEFDKVKISLGELKNIEQGLVVDIGSVYNNNVTLKVEEKTIAMGELVIINDRYGVKINQIFAEQKEPEQPIATQQPTENQMPQEYVGEQMGEMAGEPMPQEQYGEAMPQQAEDGDFDYSDFELEDEDI